MNKPADMKHRPSFSRSSDGENCHFCGAWTDADWAKPCPKAPEDPDAYMRLLYQAEDE
jgi:hypothetical protein